jgi:hypothetical protein
VEHSGAQWSTVKHSEALAMINTYGGVVRRPTPTSRCVVIRLLQIMCSQKIYDINYV